MAANVPSYTSPSGTYYISGGKDANCTVLTCPIEQSVYGYRPSLGASGAFIALYVVYIAIHMALGWRFRTFGFMAAMVLGCLDEILGYMGRILLWQNPWAHSGFIMQIVLITIGPVFFSAAIYVTLSQIVDYISPESSRLRPTLFYWIFIPCDFLSLILQAVGGAISSSTDGDAQNGVNIALAGLSFQVATLTVFILLTVDYFFRSRNIWSRAPLPTQFKIFVSALALATVLILVRCCYRVYELNQGYQRTSTALRDQSLFIGLESVLIIVAAYALVIAHPGFMFQKGKPTIAEMSEGKSTPSTTLP